MDLVPPSFAQERLWFLDRLAPSSPLYNIHVALRLAHAVNVPALQRALGDIVRRHEALRTTFVEVDGRPMQRVEPSLELPLPVVDLGDVIRADREARATALVAEEARRPFDLMRGPLLRATLMRLDARDWVLLLVMLTSCRTGGRWRC